MAVDALLFAGFQTRYNNFLGVPPVSGNHTANSCPLMTYPIEVFTTLRFLCHWLSDQPTCFLCCDFLHKQDVEIIIKGSMNGQELFHKLSCRWSGWGLGGMFFRVLTLAEGTHHSWKCWILPPPQGQVHELKQTGLCMLYCDTILPFYCSLVPSDPAHMHKFGHPFHLYHSDHI